jgi:hypothetical protein
LVVNDDGFLFRRRFRTITLPWTSARSIQIKDSQIEIATNNGSLTLNHAGIANREEVQSAFRQRSR